MAASHQGHVVFLCHAGENKAFVRQLVDRLESDGLKKDQIFYDEISLQPGDELDSIIKVIESPSLKLFVFVVSKYCFQSNKTFIRAEWETALENNKQIFPIWLDDNNDDFKAFGNLVREFSFKLRKIIAQKVNPQGISNALPSLSEKICALICGDDQPTQQRPRPSTDNAVPVSRQNIIPDGVAESRSDKVSVSRPFTQSEQKVISVLLVNAEYGTSQGDPSTVTNRQVARFLKLQGATVHSTALQASEEDKRFATEDGVILHFPVTKPRDKRKPSLEWLTYYHSIHYPDIPHDLKCIVGHVDVTSEAAKSIQQDRYQHVKLVLFNHNMPEDTEKYKGTKKAIAALKKMEDILEDTKNADAVFSLGRRIYDYFETKYKSLGESKPRQHFLFRPRPSKTFEAISVKPGGGEKVVLSVGRVTGVEKLKGHDLAARALGEVAEKIPNVRLCVRGIDEDDWEASKTILEENLHSGKIKPTLLPCGTQEAIAKDMQQAHLVLMPSRAEPFGLIGLEAIAAGIPVLISDKSGLADMITDLIEEEKCHPDMRHRIVETSVNESDLDVAAKEWAKRIVDTLKYSQSEFKKAAEFKKTLLKSKYWEESHQNLLRVCGLID